MTMFAPIPLPDSGNQVFKDVMDYFETLQKRKTQQAQFGQQLAINKQAEARAQQLLPLQLQQYRDTHNREASDFEIQQMYNGLQKAAIKKYIEEQKAGNTTFGGTPSPMTGGMPSPVPGAMPGGSPDAAAQQSAENKQAGDLTNNSSLPALPGLGQLNQLIQQNQTPNTPENASAPMPAAPPMPVMPGAAVPPVNNQAPMMGGGQGTMPAPAPTPPPQMGNAGQEIVLRQGNPAIAFMDTLGGLNPKFPKPQTHIGANGVIYTTYPSGKMTMTRAAPGMKTVAQETPEEREKREVETKVAASEGIEGAKAASKLETSGTALLSMVNKAQKLKELLTESPHLTGITAGAASSLNLSNNKKLAEFDQTTRKLQADMARYGSQRGGAQALKWAERTKPSLYKQPSYNMGMVDSIMQDAKEDYDSLAAEYKSRTGKEFPVKFPEMKSSGVTKWTMKDGKLVKE